MPTLPSVDMDFGIYADALIERFTNAALPHRLRQIAMDGSQKIPQRSSIRWLAPPPRPKLPGAAGGAGGLGRLRAGRRPRGR